MRFKKIINLGEEVTSQERTKLLKDKIKEGWNMLLGFLWVILLAIGGFTVGMWIYNWIAS